jgi:hypothetical protein
MDRKPKFFKKIERGMKTFYCIELKNGNYILYDKNMRNPIEWGSIAVVDGLLSTLPDDVKVTYFDQSDIFGFVKNNRRKPKQNPNNINKDYSGRDSHTEWVGLNVLSRSFFYIWLENGKAALFDEEMGQPVMLNQSFKGYDYKSKVDYIVSRSLSPNSSIFYFKQINGELKFRLAKRKT